MRKIFLFYSIVFILNAATTAQAQDINNAGTVSAPIITTQDADTYINTATGFINITNAFEDAIYMGNASDTFQNIGNIDINASRYGIMLGDDTSVTSGDGYLDNDKFINSGIINIESIDNGIDLDDGNNTFVNEASGKISIFSDQGDGIDFSYGTGYSVEGDKGSYYNRDRISGNDSFTNNGVIQIQGLNQSGSSQLTSPYSGIKMCAGDDNLTNTGSITIKSADPNAIVNFEAIAMGAGEDRINNTGDITIENINYAGIAMAAGNDYIINAGNINISNINSTAISMGDDVDTFINNGAVTLFDIGGSGISMGGNDDDQLRNIDFFANTGTIIMNKIDDSGITMGKGDDNLANSGKITIDETDNAGIAMGKGDDNLTNSGVITIDETGTAGINMGKGDDNLANSGKITIDETDDAGIAMGEGDDNLTNSGVITIKNNNIDDENRPGITMADDSDRFTNSGTIIMEDISICGIQTGQGDNDIFINSGNINITSNDAGIGNESGSGANFLNQSAGKIIISAGTDSDNNGIGIAGGDGAFTNEGTIEIKSGYNGIAMLDGGNTFTNAGTVSILSAENYAVFMEGAGNTFNNEGELNLNGTVGNFSIDGDLNQFGTLSINVANNRGGLISVTGDANITGGSLLVTPTEDLDEGWTKQIVDAGNLIGQFGSINSGSALYSFEANYTNSNEVWLESEESSIIETIKQNAPAPITVNQAATGSYLQRVIASQRSHPIANAIYSLKTPQEIRKAIDTMSPEPIASAVSAAKANVSAQRSNISSRLGGTRNGARADQSKFTAGLFSDMFPILNANAAQETLNSLWIKTSYLTAANEPDDGKFGFDIDARGINIGRDYQYGDFLVGVSGGYSDSNIEYTNIISEGNTDTLSLSAYGTYNAEKYYIDGILSYSNHNYDTSRLIEAGALAETATANYRADEYNIYISGAYPISINRTLNFIPLLSLQYSNYKQKAFQETGASGALEVAALDSASLVSGVGFSLEKILEYPKWKFSPSLSFIWNHEYQDTVETVTARFVGFPANLGTFSAQGYEQGADSYALGLGIVASKDKTNSLFLNYDLGMKKDFIAHSVTAGVKFYF